MHAAGAANRIVLPGRSVRPRANSDDTNANMNMNEEVDLTLDEDFDQAIHVDVFNSSDTFKLWQTVNVVFHAFGKMLSTLLAQDVKTKIVSPKFTCIGAEWCLWVYLSDPKSKFVSIALRSASDTPIKAEVGFSIRNAAGKEVHNIDPQSEEFLGSPKVFLIPEFLEHAEALMYIVDGALEFLEHAEALMYIVDGALTIEVRMKSWTSCRPKDVFVPQHKVNSRILQLFNDEDSADTTITLKDCASSGGEGREETSNKKAKVERTYYVHSLILKQMAPQLAEMCGNPKNEKKAPIVFSNQHPFVFEMLLQYIYGGEVSYECMKPLLKDFINTANRYGVVGLKLQAEALYVQCTPITLENMMEQLEYAESMQLALLKETVVDFVVANNRRVLEEGVFLGALGSLVRDILAALSRMLEPPSFDDRDNVTTMRVSELRGECERNGLPFDGSRDSMIKDLKSIAREDTSQSAEDA
jgi:hypothetical protein